MIHLGLSMIYLWSHCMQVVGRRLEEFIRPEDRASVVEVLRNILKEK